MRRLQCHHQLHPCVPVESKLTIYLTRPGLPRLGASVQPAVPEQGAVELDEAEGVDWLPVVADEDRPALLQPGEGALDDPAAGAEARLLPERLRLLAAAADVGGEAELARELAHLVVVVALVQAEVLGCLGRRLGTSDRDALKRAAGELEVVAVGTVNREPERDAAALC